MDTCLEKGQLYSVYFLLNLKSHQDRNDLYKAGLVLSGKLEHAHCSAHTTGGGRAPDLTSHVPPGAPKRVWVVAAIGGSCGRGCRSGSHGWAHVRPPPLASAERGPEDTDSFSSRFLRKRHFLKKLRDSPTYSRALRAQSSSHFCGSSLNWLWVPSYGLLPGVPGNLCSLFSDKARLWPPEWLEGRSGGKDTGCSLEEVSPRGPGRAPRVGVKSEGGKSTR